MTCHRRTLIAFLLAICWSSFPVNGQVPSPSPEEMVTIQLPGNSITDVLDLYEMLSGKKLIRDANLAGPNLTIVVPGRLPKSDAIAMIESALLLNNYTLVPVDSKTVKVIGSTKSPLGESVPLYADPESLPTTDQLVSYFMILKNISTKDALTVFQGYVTSRQQGGKMVAVPNSNAIVITDNTPLIRRLIGLQQMIDVPSANVVTELIPLTRASAEKVADILNKLLDKEKAKERQDTGGNPGAGGAEQLPPGVSSMNPPIGGSSHTMSVAPFETQILADPRTNGLLVAATEGNMVYLKKIISALDEAVSFDAPLEWHLRFVPAGEVLPVLQSFLAEGDDADKQSSSSGGSPSGGANPSSPSSSSSGGSIGGDSGEGAGKPDKLRDPDSDTGPLALNVGKARIIADRSSNTIIVVGPPDIRNKAASVLQLLDQKPKQIYLAVVIGQLTLGSGLNFGIQYPSSIPISFNVTAANNANNQVGATTGTTITGTSGNTATVDTTTTANNNAAQIVNSAFQIATTAGSSFLPALSLFGVFANSIDLNVQALESTNHFKVISRPVVYTANNKKAVISSGQQVPVPETSLTSSLGNSINGSSIASSIEYKDVVLKLEVIPLINSKNEVTLTVAQQNDNIDQNVQISNNSVPVISTQELTTTVTVPNRQTVVLGGLITEQTTTTRSGIPFLSSLPVVGYVFGAKQKAITRRELIIMIQPFIVDTPEDEAEANYIEKSNSSLNGQLYQDPVPVKRSTFLAPMGYPGQQKTKNQPLPKF